MTQWCLLAAGAFLLGYLLGRVDSLHEKLRRLENGPAGSGPARPGAIEKPRRWLVKGSAEPQPITIDDRKFVTDVNTAGLEKPVTVALGEKQTVQDDIDSAANRLAQLKRS